MLAVAALMESLRAPGDVFRFRPAKGHWLPRFSCGSPSAVMSLITCPSAPMLWKLLSVSTSNSSPRIAEGAVSVAPLTSGGVTPAEFPADTPK